MEEEKINRILKLLDMIEVTKENQEDIKKIKNLITQKKYPEMLELLKKVTNKNDTRVKAEDDSIILKKNKKEDKKQE